MVRPIQATLSKGLFDDQSLFFRMRQSCLTEEQKTRMKEQTERASAERNLAKLRLHVSKLRLSIPMTDDQAKRLLELVRKEFENTPADLHRDSLAFAMEKIPDSSLVPFLDQSQIHSLKKRFPSRQ
jgi:hypothetical protein